jgi:hypothetical protein
MLAEPPAKLKAPAHKDICAALTKYLALLPCGRMNHLNMMWSMWLGRMGFDLLVSCCSMGDCKNAIQQWAKQHPCQTLLRIQVCSGLGLSHPPAQTRDGQSRVINEIKGISCVI